VPAKIEIDEGWLRGRIEKDLRTQQDCADEIGCHVATIERACKRLQLKTQRTGPRGGASHPRWRGGRYQLGRYWYVFHPDHPNATKRGYVAEHRLVVELHLGRHLDPKEVVHHRNADPDDNRIENLVVFPSNGEHLHHELKGRTPRWSREGKERIREGVRRAASQRRSERDDGRPSRR